LYESFIAKWKHSQKRLYLSGTALAATVVPEKASVSLLMTW